MLHHVKGVAKGINRRGVWIAKKAVMGGGRSEEIQHHFVFVHGASHGGWCWYKLQTMLESAGFTVTCIDLTGAGINLTDSNTVFTADDYNRPLFTFLSQLPQHRKVILIGHSIGGGSVTEAICKFTDKISMAVYLAADMIQPGSQLSSLKNMHLGDPGNEEESMWDLIYGEGPDQPPTGIIMKKQFIRHYYYSQSPLQDSYLASNLLRPAPYRALQGMDKLPPSPEAETVPRVYMKTAKDNLFSEERQDLLVSNWPPRQLYVLQDSDHSAFFSVPSAVFACLIQAASSILN